MQGAVTDERCLLGGGKGIIGQVPLPAPLAQHPRLRVEMFSLLCHVRE